jgi:uncharacterized membrane protein YwzB
MNKIILYLIILPLTIWSCDSLNINQIFKKNKPYQSRVLYILIVFGLAYLIVNFIFDLFY